MAVELKGRAKANLCLSAQGSVIHGAFGRALLAGGAALQPDERTAQPLRGQNVLQAQRPSAASTAHAPAGRDQTPICDQVGNTRLFACFSSSLLRSILGCFREGVFVFGFAAARQESQRCVEIEGKVEGNFMDYGCCECAGGGGYYGLFLRCSLCCLCN